MPKKISALGNVDFKTELLELSQVLPNPTNPKQHPSEQIAQIASSIEAFGFNDPIAIDEHGVIIEGHGRLLAAQKLGFDRVPVIRLSHLSAAERAAYSLAHNKLTMNSGWNLELLREEINFLHEADFPSLELTGFREAEIDILFTSEAIPDTEPELDESIIAEADRRLKQVICPDCSCKFSV